MSEERGEFGLDGRPDRVGEALREGQLLVLEQIAAGDSLEAVLATLCVLVEQYARDARAVVMVSREDGTGVTLGAAPSFADRFAPEGSRQMQLFAADVLSARLGLAIPDIEERVAAEPGWVDFERLGIRSIAAVPVLGPDSAPLGLFALTRVTPGPLPTLAVDLVQQYTALVSVAIRNDQRERSLARSREAIREAQRIGRFGDLTLDLGSERCEWSDQTRILYEVPSESPTPSLTEFIEMHLAPNRVRLERALRGFGPAHVDIEVEVELPSGQRAFHRFLLSRVRSHGEQERVTGTVQDVTERKRTEDALQQAQRLESLGLLAGGIAHDFNNLLAALLANVNLLERKLPVDAPGRSSLAAIDGIVQRAADLTRQMLAYAGRSKVREELVAIDHLVRDMTGLLAAAMPKNVSVHLNLRADDFAIKGDPAQLQQVVMNLVTNAVDAIGETPGNVTVRTSNVTFSAAEVAARFPEQGVAEGRFVLLEVEDTGLGMSAETLAKMFDPFFTTKLTGRGLGLSAVRGILRAHGAGFQIESSVGVGTRFRIAFPMKGPDARATLHEAGPDGPVEAWGRIMLVDDEDEVRIASANALRESGFDVVVACDGAEALDAFEQDPQSYRAVVSDLRMPRMSGRELWEAMRLLRPAIAFILCTGFGDSSDLRDLLEDPRSLVVEKPFRIDDLVRVIERLASAEQPPILRSPPA